MEVRVSVLGVLELRVVGVVYLSLLKAVIMHFHEESLLAPTVVVDFRSFANASGVRRLFEAAVGLGVVSLVSLVLMVLFRKDILRCLARIVYKHEVRKEVSLRFLQKSFTFKLIQASATYFLKPNKSELKQELKNTTRQPRTTADKEEADKQPNRELDTCILCCESPPSVMIDGCFHGGICKECMVNYLKNNGEKCPFCKRRITKVYVLELDEHDGQYMTKGEIKLEV